MEFVFVVVGIFMCYMAFIVFYCVQMLVIEWCVVEQF